MTVSSQFKDVPNVNGKSLLLLATNVFWLFTELLRKPIERLQSYSLVLTVI